MVAARAPETGWVSDWKVSCAQVERGKGGELHNEFGKVWTLMDW